MVLIMKYLAGNNFSQHRRLERKPPGSPEKETYGGSRYQEEEEVDKWRRTPQSGYGAGSSSQPDLYHPHVCRSGADQYSQSVDYYYPKYHKYF